MAQNNYIEPDNGSGNIILLIVATILLTLIMQLVSSCKQIEYVAVPQIQRDSVYITNTRSDSVYVWDSVFIKEKNDTITIQEWHTRYKEIIINDTIYKHKVDSVPYIVEKEKIVEKAYIPLWAKILSAVGLVALIFGLIFIYNKTRFVF